MGTLMGLMTGAAMCQLEDEAELLFLKHKSRILRQSSNPLCQFDVNGGTEELARHFLEPHIGSETYCLRILLSCFRERTSGTRPTALLWAEAAAVEVVPILAVLRAADLASPFWVLF